MMGKEGKWGSGSYRPSWSPYQPFWSTCRLQTSQHPGPFGVSSPPASGASDPTLLTTRQAMYTLQIKQALTAPSSSPHSSNLGVPLVHRPPPISEFISFPWLHHQPPIITVSSCNYCVLGCIAGSLVLRCCIADVNYQLALSGSNIYKNLQRYMQHS